MEISRRRRPATIARAVAAISAAVVLLAACGSGTNSASKNSLKNVKLNWWTWTGNPQIAIKNFEKAYPSIHVTYHNVGSGSTEYTKLETALKAGSGAPDVVQIEYQALPQFIATKKLVNLAPYVGKGVSKDFPKWVWNQVTKGSTVYSIPEDIGPMGLIYEPALYKKYNLQVPKTWAQFAADAAKLHKEAPGEYMIQSPTGTLNGGWMISMFWQAGSELFKQVGNTWDVAINTPTNRKILQYWVNLVKGHGVDPGVESSATYDHNIGQEKYLSYFGAAWSPGTITPYVTKSKPQTFSVVQLPQWTAGGHVAANNGGSSNAVTVQSAHPAAAALFAKWLNTTKSGVNVDLTPYVSSGKGGRGLFPAANIRSEVPAFKTSPPGFTKGTMQVFNQAASEVNTNFEWSPWNTNFATDLGVETADAASGKITVAAALAKVQSEIMTIAQQGGYTVKAVSQ